MDGSVLTQEPETAMTREEYYPWVERQPRRRFERHQGIVVAMGAERLDHSLRKAAAHYELLRGVRAAGLPCHLEGTIRLDPPGIDFAVPALYAD